MLPFFEVYLKHAALNFGQACQSLRYLFSHPHADQLAPRGTIRHLLRSFGLRSRLILNDLFFAMLPPQTHHSSDELASLRGISLQRWFFYGYCPWRFTDTGEPKADLRNVDRRWDPRCDD